MADSITRVTWISWVGNQQRAESCYFKNRKAAELFIEGLSRDKDVFDIKYEEGLTLADVKRN